MSGKRAMLGDCHFIHLQVLFSQVNPTKKQNKQRRACAGTSDITRTLSIQLCLSAQR
jgi:hypothetical protein